MSNGNPQCDFCAIEKQSYTPAAWLVEYWLSDVAFLTPNEKDVQCQRNACDQHAATRGKVRPLTTR